jgi:hypothetical protein
VLSAVKSRANAFAFLRFALADNFKVRMGMSKHLSLPLNDSHSSTSVTDDAASHASKTVTNLLRLLHSLRSRHSKNLELLGDAYDAHVASLGQSKRHVRGAHSLWMDYASQFSSLLICA